MCSELESGTAPYSILRANAKLYITNNRDQMFGVVSLSRIRWHQSLVEKRHRMCIFDLTRLKPTLVCVFRSILHLQVWNYPQNVNLLKKLLSRRCRTRRLNFHHIFHCVLSFWHCWDFWNVRCSFAELLRDNAMSSHVLYSPWIVFTKLKKFRRSAECLCHFDIDRNSTDRVNESHLTPLRKPSAVCWKTSADRLKPSVKDGQ